MGFSFCGSSRSIAATARSDLSLSLPMSALARAVGQSDTAVKCQRSQLSPCVRIAVPSCLPASDACFACPAPCLGLLPSMYGPDPIQACVGGSAFAQAYLGSAPRRMLLMPQQARCSIWPCIRFG